MLGNKPIVEAVKQQSPEMFSFRINLRTSLYTSVIGLNTERAVFLELLAQEKASILLALVSLGCGFSGKQRHLAIGTSIARLANL